MAVERVAYVGGQRFAQPRRLGDPEPIDAGELLITSERSPLGWVIACSAPSIPPQDCPSTW